MEIENQNQTQLASENKTVIIIILILIIIVGAAYLLTDNWLKPKYQQQGYQVGAFDIINQIRQQGQIPIIDDNNTIQWIDIQKICLGGAG